MLPQVRQQACVLFRRYALSIADDNRLWPNITPAVKEACKMAMLRQLTAEFDDEEEDDSVRWSFFFPIFLFVSI